MSNVAGNKLISALVVASSLCMQWDATLCIIIVLDSSIDLFSSVCLYC